MNTDSSIFMTILRSQPWITGLKFTRQASALFDLLWCKEDFSLNSIRYLFFGTCKHLPKVFSRDSTLLLHLLAKLLRKVTKLTSQSAGRKSSLAAPYFTRLTVNVVTLCSDRFIKQDKFV